jgi:hypothetical protein
MLLVTPVDANHPLDTHLEPDLRETTGHRGLGYRD